MRAAALQLSQFVRQRTNICSGAAFDDESRDANLPLPSAGIRKLPLPRVPDSQACFSAPVRAPDAREFSWRNRPAESAESCREIARPVPQFRPAFSAGAAIRDRAPHRPRHTYRSRNRNEPRTCSVCGGRRKSAPAAWRGPEPAPARPSPGDRACPDARSRESPTSLRTDSTTSCEVLPAGLSMTRIPSREAV